MKVQFVLANKRTSGKIRKNSNQMHPSDQKVFEDIINKIEEKDSKKYVLYQLFSRRRILLARLNSFNRFPLLPRS